MHDGRVGAVIAVSPVRLSRSYFLASKLGEEYERIYQRAVELVESGESEAMMRVSFLGDSMIGAKSFLEKYGSEHYNVVNYANKVDCPLLIMAGTLETHPRLLDCAQDMYQLVRDRADADFVLIEGGSHALPEMHEGLVDPIIEWLGRSTAPILIH